MGSAAQTTEPSVLYIMGTGRSGTTILEVLLTQASGAASSGELTHIWRDGLIGDAECVCGTRAHACAVWSRVFDALQATPAQARHAMRAFRSLESHAAFGRVALGLVPPEARRAHAHWNRRLFRALAAAHGTAWVVDSSKYAGRALLLAKTCPQTRVICLTRSPEGLIGAFQKHHEDEQRPKPWWAVALYYAYVLACMRVVRLRLRGRCLSLRYEELMADPAAVLARIEAWSGLDLSGARVRLREGADLEIGHIVTGNRLRKHGRIRFEPGTGGRRDIGGLPRAVARALGRYRALLGY